MAADVFTQREAIGKRQRRHAATGGQLEAIWYHMPEEQVRQTNSGPITEERSSTFVQAEYQQPIAGYGASVLWAAFGRCRGPQQSGVAQAPMGVFAVILMMNG